MPEDQQANQRYSAGSIIFNEGDNGNCAYLIESGRVEIFVNKNDQELPLGLLGPGEIFGEMAIIDNEPRSASARATENVTLTVIAREQVYDRVNKADNVIRLLIQILMNNLRKNNKKSGQFLTDNLSQKDFSKAAIERMKLESDVQTALLKNEFQLHYQPIVDLSNAEIKGFEALIRWFNPKRGLIRPDMYMDVIEDSALIIPLGYWIIETAMRDIEYIRKTTNQDLFMSINVSTKQFTDPSFVVNIEKIRKRYDVEAHHIKLEVTERILVEGEETHTMMSQCRELGYLISIDDFGTGYSSLSYLIKMNVDAIKIDRTFVSKMLLDHKTYAIIKSIMTISKGLGITSIAEGIENAEEAVILKKIGCDFGQGYLYSRPVSIGDIISMLVQEIKSAA